MRLYRAVSMACVFAAIGWACAGRTAAADDKQAAFDPTDQYAVQEIEGWKVLVNRQFLQDQPDLAERALAHMRHQLYQIVRCVPAAAVEKLRTIRIWVEEKEPHHPCMCYHPDVGWLEEHGMNPDKAHGVEVANARAFLTWTIDQPWMVLHELAHGYHHQFLADGFENQEVRAAYRRAVESKSYESVLRIGGEHEKAYAMTNPQEYFAETSEAFFGTNDFYPFVRSELQEHDPQMVEVLKNAWQEPPRGRHARQRRPDRTTDR